MSINRVAIITGVVCLARLASAQVELNHARADGRDIRMTTIADGVYQFTTIRDSYVRLLNTIAVETDRDVLVFNTGTRPSAARTILDRMRELTHKPVRFVVNSHGHPDHWLGNGVYAAAFPDLEIIATAETNEHMHRMAPVWGPRFTTELETRHQALLAEQQSRKRADGTPITAEDLRQDSLDLVDYESLTRETVENARAFPTLIYRDTLVFVHGGREFRFMSVAGDADGTTVLWLPKERIVLTGDAVSYPIPFVGPHPNAQVETLRRIAALAAIVTVPGHGPAFRDTLFVSLERRLLEAVVNGVAALRRDGIGSLAEMQKRITAAELRAAFTHGDADLETRFAARVKDLVALAFADATTSRPR